MNAMKDKLATLRGFVVAVELEDGDMFGGDIVSGCIVEPIRYGETRHVFPIHLSHESASYVASRYARLAILRDGRKVKSAQVLDVESVTLLDKDKIPVKVRFMSEQEEARLADPVSYLENKIAELGEECNYVNWDGYGADPVSKESVAVALAIIRSLPQGMMLPDPGVEPDGAITLDWYSDRNNILSVSTDASGRLPYAFITYSHDSGHGVADFTNGNLPENILDMVREIEKMTGGNARKL